MPHAFNAHPDHPAVSFLIRLHADLGGKLLENRKQAVRLANDMKHVEAVIRLFDPAFNIVQIAARRRYRGNAWFKRGTLFRHALDVLRDAQGRPMTAREITDAMLAAKGVTATPKQVRDLVGGVLSSLRNQSGKTVETVGEGMPKLWRVI